MDQTTLLGQEWQTLQNHYEQHEKNALLIKLTCLVVCVAGIAAHVPAGWLAFSTVLLWLQEGIFKTYQARLGERLLIVEGLLSQAHLVAPAMQLHTDWAASRPSGVRLIAGYAVSACRPTVVFPYLPILIVGWVWG